MFTIRFATTLAIPDLSVVIRTDTEGWQVDHPGEYTDGAWIFEFNEQVYPKGFSFKFLIPPARWMRENNIEIGPQATGAVLSWDDTLVSFPPSSALITENGIVAQRLLARNVDPSIVYDVIVVGSGMGGGLLASQLADRGKNVLVLEAGSYLFPTHVGNLPRRLLIGQFSKHIWSLWQDFQVVNYRNVNGSQFKGAQAFNLGGRSLFWGGVVPQLTQWQLAAWPQVIQDYLRGSGYAAALQAFNSRSAPPSPFEDNCIQLLQAALPGWNGVRAPMAIQYVGATNWSMPVGMFSTADLIIEDVLVREPPQLQPAGHKPLTVNLNHAVWNVMIDPDNPRRVLGVRCYDLLAQTRRIYRGNAVVLAAGTIESPKIAQQSAIIDPNDLIGRGITDHRIRYRHFTVPPDRLPDAAPESAKVLLQHPLATTEQHAFDIIVELGAELNQGRYVDPQDLENDVNIRNGYMLCEIVFQYYSSLIDANYVKAIGDPAYPVDLLMQSPQTPPALVAEADAIASAVFAALGAQPVLGEDPGMALMDADMGAVAHEVGTLRMGDAGQGVVDSDLKFLAYDNLYACDNSVFPVSPAANPSLTLAALAIRLAHQLS